MNDWVNYGIGLNSNSSNNKLYVALWTAGALGSIIGELSFAQTAADGTSLSNSGVLPSYETPLFMSAADTSITNSLFTAGKVDFTSKVNVTPNIKSDYSYNSDIALADNEIARLPVGKTDQNGDIIISSVITIRQKTQNVWSH
jgi:hypothetical protein